MDPLLAKTPRQALRSRQIRIRLEKRSRRQSRFEQWAWTEIPSYRLGLLLGYSFAIYFGLSALIAGVPAFELGAPAGWTPIWSWLLIAAGPVGLVGILKETPRFRTIELVASSILAGSLVVYAGTMLFLAYVSDLDDRAAAGAGILWLSVAPMIRTTWLLAQVILDNRNKKLGA
jgi:hypothetical protein